MALSSLEVKLNCLGVVLTKCREGQADTWLLAGGQRSTLGVAWQLAGKSDLSYPDAWVWRLQSLGPDVALGRMLASLDAKK